MKIDIIRAENGWILRRHYLNKMTTEDFVFKSIEELAAWIIDNRPPAPEEKGD